MRGESEILEGARKKGLGCNVPGDVGEGGVRNSAIADVIKIWMWAVGSLVVGLGVTPVVYNGGKALFELVLSKDFSSMINRVAAWCGTAEMEDFFKLCWGVAAVVLVLPLIEWLGLKNHGRWPGPGGLRLPHHGSAERGNGQVMERNGRGLLEGLLGFFLVCGCFFLIGVALVEAGAFSKNRAAAWWGETFFYDLGVAVGMALVVETFYRRVVLGVFLRAMNGWLAAGLAAVMFGMVPLVLSGFSKVGAVDGELLGGWRLAGMVLGGGDVFFRLMVVFMPWFAFGLVLGWARCRTASVWLPWGFLAGWLLAERLFSRVVVPVEIPDRFAGYFASESLHYGLIPLLGVIVIGGLVPIITHGYSFQRDSEAGD